MSSLKISIITITYNSEKTVRQTFESVYKQKRDNLEYIIIDGGSTDSTLKIAEEYKDIISKIISEPDEGISDAMNKGIAAATGDLIGIIHSDDMLAEGALDILEKEYSEEYDVFYGDVIVCDEAGKHTHILCAKEDLSGMQYRFALNHPSTFVTKKCYEKYGVFDKKLRCSMDYDLFLRYYKAGAKFKYINKNLAVYRLGGVNQKMRKVTVNESCYISIRHGGNKFKAYMIKYKKKLLDFIRPLAYKLGIHNKRVKKF
ncbi:MAG: glycosyltransferase [Ruminococcaceae bacterium]|nr:glycosyltransferase [Oscillospiraceae bacterium]